jgi:hypothetical protein
MPEERLIAHQIDTVTGDTVTPMADVDDYALPPAVAEQEAAARNLGDDDRAIEEREGVEGEAVEGEPVEGDVATDVDAEAEPTVAEDDRA